MKRPEQIPEAVKAGLARYAAQHSSAGITVATLEAQIQWDAFLGCYWFERGTVLHGVELDGHVHT